MEQKTLSVDSESAADPVSTRAVTARVCGIYVRVFALPISDATFSFTVVTPFLLSHIACSLCYTGVTGGNDSDRKTN